MITTKSPPPLMSLDQFQPQAKKALCTPTPSWPPSQASSLPPCTTACRSSYRTTPPCPPGLTRQQTSPWSNTTPWPCRIRAVTWRGTQSPRPWATQNIRRRTARWTCGKKASELFSVRLRAGERRERRKKRKRRHRRRRVINKVRGRMLGRRGTVRSASTSRRSMWLSVKVQR